MEGKPERGDMVELWIKKWQSEVGNPGVLSWSYHTLDDLLDDYRLRADTESELMSTIEER